MAPLAGRNPVRGAGKRRTCGRTVPVGGSVAYVDVASGSLDVMWKGQISFETPMLFACGFLVTFLFGGLTGVMLAAPVIDFHVTASHFVVAQLPLRAVRDDRVRHLLGDLFLVPDA